MLSALIVAFLCMCSLTAGEVIHLTGEDFSKHVDGSSNILVEFYAPW